MKSNNFNLDTILFADFQIVIARAEKGLQLRSSKNKIKSLNILQNCNII